MTKKFAIIYDFDRTLCPKQMQEYAFIPSIGMSDADFWEECNRLKLKHNMDGILAYMYVMIKKSHGKVLFTDRTLKEQGAGIELYKGVKEWFDLINAEGKKRGLELQHYIISSGIKKIIEGTDIAKNFNRIYACEFCYDEDGVPFWPSLSLNYTSKTQFLFRISKGTLDVTDDTVNRYQPPEKRYIPFSNMIYIGDGDTDIPCMKITRMYGGRAIGVFVKDNEEFTKKLLDDNRVDFAAEADYTEGGKLYNCVLSILDDASASC